MSNQQSQPQQVAVLRLSLPLVQAIRDYLGEGKEKEVGNITKALDFEVSQQLQPQEPQEPPKSPEAPTAPPKATKPVSPASKTATKAKTK